MRVEQHRANDDANGLLKAFQRGVRTAEVGSFDHLKNVRWIWYMKRQTDPEWYVKQPLQASTAKWLTGHLANGSRHPAAIYAEWLLIRRQGDLPWRKVISLAKTLDFVVSEDLWALPDEHPWAHNGE